MLGFFLFFYFRPLNMLSIFQTTQYTPVTIWEQTFREDFCPYTGTGSTWKPLPGCWHWGDQLCVSSRCNLDGCSSRTWENRFTQKRSQVKQNINCKVLKCALPIQLSFLTSRNCAQQGCSYPPPKHLAPPGTGYCSHWSAGLGCYGNSWLPELFIFPLQWPTKRCTGSSAASCQ